jgi:hypothetical protein
LNLKIKERKIMTPNTTIVAPVAPVAVRTLPLKVSAKGAISIYGLGRFPVTLYKSQMLMLLANKDKIEAFIERNNSLLASKD